MKQKTHGCRLCDEKWHLLEEADVYEELQSGPQGLDKTEAARRLAVYGPNTLPAKKPPTVWQILLHQVLNPLIFILLVAAAASIAIGEAADALFILIVIALNSGLGAYQEYQAEQSASSLQQLLKITARVRRAGQETEISSEEVVPGDIVLLESGNKVPADLRVIQANGLAADESFLTGESIAAEKTAGRLDADSVISDRWNMAFAGSTVASGRGVGIAVGTGKETQVGVIAETVTRSESAKPPLVQRMDRFVTHVSLLVLLVSAGLGLLLWAQGQDAPAIFFFVVALAVAAIPEGLPVALTVALSIATKRMARRNVIVRRLTAVESLGSCTVIASDKTGTLTVNQQTARLIWLPGGEAARLSGEGYNGDGRAAAGEGGALSGSLEERLQRLAELAILANEGRLFKQEGGWAHRGDAMDVAFLAAGFKLGLDPEEVRRTRRIAREIPYESERKFAAAFFEKEGGIHVAAKGAAEAILDFCSRMAGADGPVALDRETIERQAEAMAQKGLRVLAVAGGEAAALPAQDHAPALSGLVLHGLVGFIDPLRPEAAEAVDTCKAAGIQVIMITGDHPSTAAAIARELNLGHPEEPVVTGRQLSEAGTPDSPAFEKKVLSTHVFARVSPNQKLEIVDVLIRRGEFVAVTGDGVNDAPALRRANIGVAMGSGTDVAKEVGSMIVADDNFASIVAGVEEGRFAYDNVRKVIYLLVSTGAATVMMVIAALLNGLPLPLLAVQLLWLNVVTNGIQDVALAFEGGEPGAMKRRPRRPEETIFDAQMVSQTLVAGVVIGALAFGYFYWLIEVRLMEETLARNSVLLLIVLMQNVHVFNCRSESTSAFRVPLHRNYVLIFGVAAAQAIHIASMHIPFMQAVLGTSPVGFDQWTAALGMALAVLAVMEAFKFFKRRGTARRPDAAAI
jgi:magnesium-transporting ATPase (P-type)